MYLLAEFLEAAHPVMGERARGLYQTPEIFWSSALHLSDHVTEHNAKRPRDGQGRSTRCNKRSTIHRLPRSCSVPLLRSPMGTRAFGTWGSSGLRDSYSRSPWVRRGSSP